MIVPSTFAYDLPPTRVVFGIGALEHLARELDALQRRRVLVVTTASGADRVAPVLQAAGARVVDVFTEAAEHVPVDRVRATGHLCDRLNADAVLAFGGGSTIGLAKAAMLERRLPIVAVPTTYSGSEMTGIWGMTDAGSKRTGRDPGIAPRLVLYDPALTLSLPVATSAASGLNAVAHAVEALYAQDVGPLATGAADEALRSLGGALPVIVQRPADIEARTLALRGAHAAGVALQLAAMGLHHKICHVLGGTFGLPHAETHAAVLPHVMVFNAPAAPDAMARIAAAFGQDDAVESVCCLERMLGLTRRLGALGLRKGDVDRAAELTTASAYANPRPVTVEAVRRILQDAF